jgi:hypothetical protein
VAWATTFCLALTFMLFLIRIALKRQWAANAAFLLVGSVMALLGMFGAFERFMMGERPYGYQDVQAESGDLRAWGMKADGRILLWIDNRQHTWKRVTGQEPIPPASGTITIPGVEGHWLIQWWDTETGTITRRELVHAGGALILDIDGLAGDVAVKAIRSADLTPRSYLPLVMKE